jgi:hypothetical protein
MACTAFPAVVYIVRKGRLTVRAQRSADNPSNLLRGLNIPDDRLINTCSKAYTIIFHAVSNQVAS